MNKEGDYWLPIEGAPRCVDCRHFLPDEQFGGGSERDAFNRIRFGRCVRPNVKKNLGALVGYERSTGTYAQVERGVGACGPEGRFWEPRHQTAGAAE